MDELVNVIKNDVFTDSLIIAQGTKNKHESVQKRIRDYKEEFLTLGKLGFEIRSMPSGQEMKLYQLNEQQATFLITLLRNNKIVVAFKLELVKQFYAMRSLLLERQTKDWQHTRQQGKITRNAEIDIIKQLVEYAKSQGSEHSDKLYLTYSKLANNIAGVGKRDRASINQLNNLNLAENIILHCVCAGIAQNMHYKKIYQECKARLEQFQEIAYLKGAEL